MTPKGRPANLTLPVTGVFETENVKVREVYVKLFFAPKEFSVKRRVARRERRERRNFQNYVIYEVTFRGLKHLILANFRLFDHRHISNEIITLRTS